MEKTIREKNRCISFAYFIKYTVLFCILALLVFGYFPLYGKSFIDKGAAFGDGLVQHFKALCYYAQWLRGIVRTLLTEHRLEIAEWSFSIGYGSDIMTTLHYYVIGDPFNLFSVFIPIRYMQYYYGFMILFRMYCAGVAFSAYSFYMTKEKRNESAVLAGSILYVFCHYAISSGVKHPYFINPMVYLPLLLLGVEQILHRENPLLFIISVCVSTVSNFYFFYMLVIFTVLYVLLRLWAGRKQYHVMGSLKEIARIGGYSLTGLGVGAVIFLPVVLAVFQDSRFSGENTLTMLLYPSSYYTKFLAALITTDKAGYWSFLGIAAIGLPALFLLFLKRKENTELKVAVVVLTGFLMVPAVGYLLNACSYVANRWVWAYVFVLAFALVKMWPSFFELSAFEKRALTCGLLVYFVLCLALDNSRTMDMAVSMACAFAVVCLLQCDFSSAIGRNRIQKGLIFCIMIVNVAVNGFNLFSVISDDLLEQYVNSADVDETVFETQDNAVAAAAEEAEDTEIPYTIDCSSKKVSVQGNSFVSTAKEQTVTVNFETISGCELYLLVEGFGYQGCSPLELYEDDSEFDPLNLYTQEEWDSKTTMEKEELQHKYRNWSETSSLQIIVSSADEDGLTNTQQWYHYTPSYSWYSGKENYTVNLGYSDSGRNSISITLPAAGIYSFESLRVICQPLDNYEEGIESLSEECMENVVFGTDSVSGDITVTSDKVLCATIPYANGWEAYVDGQKMEILQVNGMYSGLLLTAGTHEIVFVYHTPGLRVGAILCLLFVLITIYLVVNWKRFEKKQKM